MLWSISGARLAVGLSCVEEVDQPSTQLQDNEPQAYHQHDRGPVLDAELSEENRSRCLTDTDSSGRKR